MKKKQKDKVKLIILWVVAVILVVTAVIMVFKLPRKAQHVVVEVGQSVIDDGEESATKETGYANETSFSGSSYVPASLFAKPFRKSADYVMNKDYINQIGSEQATALSLRVKEAFENIFLMNYETLDKETYQATLEEYLAPAIAVYFPMSDRLTENVSELGAYIADKIETRDLIMESTVYTDKCLVYYDEGCDIVRIKLSMVVYSCNDLEELKSVLNVKDIELGKPFSIIYDVYTGPGLYMENKETYQVQRVVEP